MGIGGERALRCARERPPSLQLRLVAVEERDAGRGRRHCCHPPWSRTVVANRSYRHGRHCPHAKCRCRTSRPEVEQGSLPPMMERRRRQRHRSRSPPASSSVAAASRTEG
nr:hypothetical protein Iba_chr15bCG9140 [Ipomoea batatas]